MYAEERQQAIASLVISRGRASVAELAQTYDVTTETVRRDLGPLAVIGDVHFVSMLPKTRSGKIMRRVFKAVILDHDPGDISTIEDEGSVHEARQAWMQMKDEIRQNV